MALGIVVFALAIGLLAQSSVPKSKPNIFAQKLVDETIQEHPEVVILAFHVTPPGKAGNVIIASNIGRIGKKADEDDMRVINTGKSNLEVNKAGNHFEVELVILDQAGNNIGAAGVVFNYKAGDDQKALEKKPSRSATSGNRRFLTKKLCLRRRPECGRAATPLPGSDRLLGS